MKVLRYFELLPPRWRSQAVEVDTIIERMTSDRQDGGTHFATLLTITSSSTSNSTTIVSVHRPTPQKGGGGGLLKDWLPVTAEGCVGIVSTRAVRTLLAARVTCARDCVVYSWEGSVTCRRTDDQITSEPAVWRVQGVMTHRDTSRIRHRDPLGPYACGPRGGCVFS